METFKKYLTATLDVSNIYTPPPPLNLTSEFDEKDVMETFKKYLTATLDVSYNYTPLPPESHIGI